MGRYARATHVREVMNINEIGAGDIDLLDALEHIKEEGKLVGPIEDAYDAITEGKTGEYEWHGNQEDHWTMLVEEVQDDLEDLDLLVDEDDEDEEDD